MVRSFHKYNRHLGHIVQRGRGDGFRTSYEVKVPDQRGRGFGGVLRRSGKRFVGVMKKKGVPVLKRAGRGAINALTPIAQELLSDVVSGKNIKQSIKSRSKQGLSAAALGALGELQQGSGYRKRKKPRNSRNVFL